MTEKYSGIWSRESLNRTRSRLREDESILRVTEFLIATAGYGVAAAGAVTLDPFLIAAGLLLAGGTHFLSKRGERLIGRDINAGKY